MNKPYKLQVKSRCKTSTFTSTKPRSPGNQVHAIFPGLIAVFSLLLFSFFAWIWSLWSTILLSRFLSLTLTSPDSRSFSHVPVMAMAARPQTPVQDAYSIPSAHDPGVMNRGYGTLRSSSRPSSYAGTGSAFFYNHGTPEQSSQIPHNPRFKEELDTISHRSSIALDRPPSIVHRSASTASQARSTQGTSTLRKKASLSKKGSLRRNGSRRSLGAGSVKSLSLGDREKYPDGTEDVNSVFMVPIPTSGNPTEVLSTRFQGM